MMHPPAGKRPDTPPLPRDGDPTVRLEAGDSRTLAALYDRHAGVVYSLAMRIAGEPPDAEAIVHGVFAAAWSEAGRHADGYAPDVQWLLGTTRIRAIDHVRGGSTPGVGTATRQSTDGDGSAESPSAELATLHLPDPARDRITGEHGPDDLARLRSAFRQLPPLERIAIELAYFEGLTISQIATRLEQAPHVANTRIRTGLERLAGSVAEAPASDKPRHDTLPTSEMAGLYALGALNASERAAFDAHLEVDRGSVDEVLSLLPVVRRLALTATPHEPPAGLRERIMETVTGAPLPGAARENATESSPSAPAETAADVRAQDGSEPADDGDGPRAADSVAGSDPGDTLRGSEPADTQDEPGHVQTGSAPEPATTALDDALINGIAEPARPADEAAQSVSTPRVQEPTPSMQHTNSVAEGASPNEPAPSPGARSMGGRWALPLLLAVSLVAAAALGLAAARQSRLATALQENLDAANTQARIAELETAAARGIADGLRAGADILTADNVQTLDLAGQPAAPGARGRLYRGAGGGLLAVTGLPPVPPGRVYQLWLIPDATPIGAALLSVDAEGRAMAAVALPEGATDSVPAAVTLEPAGGVANPGGDVYLLGQP